MCIATIIGFISLATTFLMVGIVSNSNLSAMLDPPSATFVIGGTMAALCISFSLKDIIDTPLNCLGYAIVPPKARNATVDYRLPVGIEFYRRAGTYAFAVGWLGSLLGIIIMPQHVADISLDDFARRLSICMLTTLYGTVISYLFCLPIRTKLARIQEELATPE